MHRNAIKSLQGILSKHGKDDTGWIIPLKEPPQSPKYRAVLNYILVGNRYLVKEKWELNHEIFKEKARNDIRKSKVRPPQAHRILTKKLDTIWTSRRIMSPNNHGRGNRKIIGKKPHRRTFSPKYCRNGVMGIT